MCILQPQYTLTLTTFRTVCEGVITNALQSCSKQTDDSLASSEGCQSVVVVR